MIYFAKIDDINYEIEISEKAGRPEVKIGGLLLDVECASVKSGLYQLLLDGKRLEIQIQDNGDGLYCWLGSKSARCEVIDEKTAKYAKIINTAGVSHKVSALTSPMPGLIIKVEVEIGQRIQKGGGLIIMEAMKMENELKAAHSCIIKEIKIAEGQTVDKNQVLIVFE